jgi:hypothetical protein
LQRAVRTTVREAAEALIAGIDDGSILDRSGKPYKPSAARGYAQTLRAYVLPVLGGRRIDEVRRADVQELVELLRRRGLAPSTIHNVLDPLRVLFRRAVSSRSTRPRGWSCRRCADSVIGSSRQRTHKGSSTRCPTTNGRCGRSPCSPVCAAASCSGCAGPTLTSMVA